MLAQITINILQFFLQEDKDKNMVRVGHIAYPQN